MAYFVMIPYAVLLAVGLFIWAFFTVRRWIKGPYVPVEHATKGAFALLPGGAQDGGYWFLEKLVAVYVRAGISPNHLTILGSTMGLASAACLALGAFEAGGVLLLFSALVDGSDGWLARRTGRQTAMGGFIDSCLDRCVDASLYLGLAIYYRELWWMMVACMVCASFSQMVSYVRAKAEAAGVECKYGMAQRVSRIFWLTLALGVSPLLVPYLEPGAERPFHHTVAGVIATTAVFALLGSLQRLVGSARRIDALERS